MNSPFRAKRSVGVVDLYTMGLESVVVNVEELQGRCAMFIQVKFGKIMNLNRILVGASQK